MNVDDISADILLFGFANSVIDPLCIGCLGFLMTFRLTRSLQAKLIAMGFTIAFAAWMEMLWPAFVARQLDIGVSTTDPRLQSVMEERHRVGVARYGSGENAGLWRGMELDLTDLIAVIVMVPGAFALGFFVTGRSWVEASAPCAKPSGHGPTSPNSDGFEDSSFHARSGASLAHSLHAPAPPPPQSLSQWPTTSPPCPPLDPALLPVPPVTGDSATARSGIRAHCWRCGGDFEVEQSTAGDSVKCPACGGIATCRGVP